MVRLADGEPVFVEATIEQNFKITPQQLAAAITPRTKAIILCSPSNPTGSVYSLEELEGLAEVLRQHPEVLVIADEIYEHINYVGKHASIATLPDMQERTAIINGVSKAYAMTGWRIGFVAAPLALAKAVNKLKVNTLLVRVLSLKRLLWLLSMVIKLPLRKCVKPSFAARISLCVWRKKFLDLR